MAESFVFDERAADKAVRFFEKILVHTKGEWSGHGFTLMDWQRDGIIRPLFGWKRADGKRRYRTAYIEIPRKNGKTTLAAGIALYLLFADEEPGAEVYSAASDRDQAAICFEQAKGMVEDSPLRKFADVWKRAIVVPKTRSSYKVLSADAFTKHGLNASGVVFDELHAQPTRELWDVLTTATGARRQPLVVAITTAGYDRTSICWEQHVYAQQVLSGVIEDPAFFAYVSAAEESADWTDPAVWHKANPALGQTIKLDYLQTECERAKQVPAYQNTFRRLHLNQWTLQDTRWLDLGAWDACGLPVDLDGLAGRTCYGGLDLASTTDLAAFVLVFPPSEEAEPYQVLPVFWCPAENILERARRDRVPYDAWARDGFLRATPGNVIDYATICTDIQALGAQFNIQEIAFDRWGAAQMSQQLDGAGFTMIPFGQGFASLSAPTKELLRLVLDKSLAHGGHPVLRWMADNAAARQDPAGNIKLDKAKSTGRIDGLIALIMGLDRATRRAVSVYESRGVLVL